MATAKFYLAILFFWVAILTYAAAIDNDKETITENTKENRTGEVVKGLCDNPENVRAGIFKWCRNIKTTFRRISGYIPNAVKYLFSGENKRDDTVDDVNTKEKYNTDGKKESGTLDFIGRDIVRNVSKVIGKFVGFKPSNMSAGLDSNKTFFSGVLSEFQNQAKLIYPGTKWCGGGDRAKNSKDLGIFQQTDKCCRNHDKCPDNIASGETKHGLVNSGLFVRSHCDCDTEFYNCLHKVNAIISKEIGITYFSLLGPQCFNQSYPITGCYKSKKGKCVSYQFDNKGEKIYQWFDSPTFIN